MENNKKTAPSAPTAQQLIKTLRRCFKNEMQEDCIGCMYNGVSHDGEFGCLESLMTAAANLIEEQAKKISVLAETLVLEESTLSNVVRELECPCCTIRRECFERQRNEVPETNGCSAMWTVKTRKALEKAGKIKYISAEKNRENLKLIEKICQEEGLL